LLDFDDICELSPGLVFIRSLCSALLMNDFVDPIKVEGRGGDDRTRRHAAEQLDPETYGRELQR